MTGRHSLTTEHPIGSMAELNQQIAWVVDQFGPDAKGCGGWTWDPPCGGCVSCVIAQVSHGWHNLRAEADRYQAAGFEWAPFVIDWYAIVIMGGSMAVSHDWYGHYRAGEVKK